ncbi:MAG: hypothetical protein KC649_07880, partial [Candidatus Omnitrophica bacterium]|nr:hypothetical protein [Candidatus Omnitrophota bacterium]
MVLFATKKNIHIKQKGHKQNHRDSNFLIKRRKNPMKTLALPHTPAQMAAAKDEILNAVTEIHRLLKTIDKIGQPYKIYPALFRDR